MSAGLALAHEADLCQLTLVRPSPNCLIRRWVCALRMLTTIITAGDYISFISEPSVFPTARGHSPTLRKTSWQVIARATLTAHLKGPYSFHDSVTAVLIWTEPDGNDTHRLSCDEAFY